jgi:hypothetical protein
MKRTFIGDIYFAETAKAIFGRTHKMKTIQNKKTAHQVTSGMIPGQPDCGLATFKESKRSYYYKIDVDQCRCRHSIEKNLRLS